MATDNGPLGCGWTGRIAHSTPLAGAAEEPWKFSCVTALANFPQSWQDEFTNRSDYQSVLGSILEIALTMTNSTTDSMAIVLAAGKGTRMESDLPKVLVPVGGKPMLRYVIDTLQVAGLRQIVIVVGYQAGMVRRELAGEQNMTFVEQHEQLGTGHAVMMCRDVLGQQRGPVMILSGDSPMLQASTISTLLQQFQAEPTACLLGTVHKDNPTGWGRILRNQTGQFEGIVEEKDAAADQRAIQEVNASTYVFDARELLYSLDKLTNDNAQGEYYITDCPGILLEEGKPVFARNVLQPCEALSINNVDDLRDVERELRRMS